MIAAKRKLARFAVVWGVAVLVVGAGYVAGQGPGHEPPAAYKSDAAVKAPSTKGGDAPAKPGALVKGVAPVGDFARNLFLVQTAKQNEIDGDRPEVNLARSNGQILVVSAPDRRSFKAMNLNGGGWEEYKVPGDAQAVVALMEPSVAALGFGGPDVREVAIFNARVVDRARAVPAHKTATLGGYVPLGTWSRPALRQPAQGEVVPLKAGDVFLYHVGHDIYVYRPAVNTWTDLHLEGAAMPRVQQTANAILVWHGEDLHVYSIPAGRWIRAGEPPVPVRDEPATTKQ